MHLTGVSLIIAILYFAVAPLASSAASAEWTEDSFEAFSDGTFLDAGSNAYVSADGRIQIINRWDLNNDGHLEVIMPAGHGQTEKEDTYVYLNNGGDIDGRLLIKVPANGSMDGIVRDFNQDGLNDLAVCNGDNGLHQRTHSYVYYGTKDGFTAEKRVTLPSHNSTGICAGDFDGDGLLDLAIASRFRKGTVEKFEDREISFIYWNSPDGFKPDNRTEFSFNDRGAQNVAAGDLDGDGKDDLVILADKTYIYYGKDGSAKDHTKKPAEIPFSGSDATIGDVNKDGRKDLAINLGGEVRVLLGTRDGFDTDKPIVLKGDRASDVVLADFDGDGMDDVAISNFGTGNDAANSFVYYSDGKDFSSREKLEIPTFGATALSAGDINGDGKPELVVSNQRINYYHALQSAVFWNKDGKFAFGNRTQLDTQGSTSNCIGDVNNDGRPDVVFFNLEGYYRDGPAYTRIYWGDGTRNYTPNRVLDVAPTHYVTGVGHADLDDDGDVELIINQGRWMNGLPYDHAVPTVICWNTPDGMLDVRSNLTLESPSGGGTKILDFNRDGYLDLLIGGTVRNDDGSLSIPIFLGSADGFKHGNRMNVPLSDDAGGMRVPLAMDLNEDGFIDLAAQLEAGKVRLWYGNSEGYAEARVVDIDLGRKDALMYINAADLNKDGWLDLILPCRQIGADSEVTSFIYFGSPDGFSNGRRTEVETSGPYDLAVADFDKDGWLDVFMNSYKGNETRNNPSLLYWGSPDGLTKRPPAEIPTYASSGAEAADFDGDGWIDLYSANHRKDGFTDKPGPHKHQTDSMIYWGGKEGFSPDRRMLIPSYGPHPVNIRDVGNSYDRGLYEDYLSSAREFSSGQTPETIRWKAQTPHGTGVKFQVRTAKTPEALASAAWSEWIDKSGSEIAGANADGQRWIQYRARLTTPNGGATPYLSSVTITFR